MEFILKPIDLKDSFSLDDFIANVRQYSSIEDALSDLSRLVRYGNIDEGCGCMRYYVKVFDENGSRIRFVSEFTMSKMLKGARLLGRTVFAILQKHCFELEVHGIVFDTHSDDDVLNLFAGYKYQPIKGNIKPFLDYVGRMCNDEAVTKYTLNWTSRLIQEVSDGSRAALIVPESCILFADVLFELLSGYSVRLIPRYDSPYIEMKRLIISHGPTPYEYDCLRHVISEDQYWAREPYVPYRNANCAASFIFISSDPHLIEPDDWRSLRITPDGMPDDTDLKRAMLEEGFYESLMYYLLNRDIKGFQPFSLHGGKLADRRT